MHCRVRNILALVVACCATIQVAQAVDVVRIGALIDQSGPSTSPFYRAAIELAQKQMNAALSAHRSPTRIEVVFADTQSAAPRAQAEAIRLINEAGVKALVTMSSGETVAVNKLNYDPASPARYKVPVTCFQCSSGFINNPAVVETDPLVQAAERDADHWLFRVFYIANYEAAVQVKLALSRGKPDMKIGIFADAGHRSLASAVVDTLPALAPQATAAVTYFSGVENLAADWKKVVNGPSGKPDLVILAMLPQAATEAVKAYRQAGYALPVQSNNSLRRNYILPQLAGAGDGLEGSSVEQVAHSASGRAFLQQFRQATGQQPEMTASGAYDATVALMLAALVAEHQGSMDAAQIQRALLAINTPKGKVIRPGVRDFRRAVALIRHGKSFNYEGAYSSLDWNGVGDIYPALVHWKIAGGQFTELERYSCNPQQPLCQ